MRAGLGSVRTLGVIGLILGIGSISSMAYPIPAFCGETELDAASQEALLKTQAMLRDSQQRAQAVSKNPQASWIDQQARSLGGNEANTDAIYDLSADILADLVKQTNGDPEKMKKLMDEAKNNPAAFANRLSPEQRSKLQNISRRIPAGTQAPKKP